MQTPFRIAVGIATAGRSQIVTENLRELSHQTRLPDGVFVCPAAATDYDVKFGRELPFPLCVVTAKPGLPAQRNALLNAAQNFDILIFFDDDFLASNCYVAEVERCFAAQPGIAGMSGHVIADYVTGPGIDVATARALLASFKQPSDDQPLTTLYNMYGCNMAVRLEPVRTHELRFDEALPLYGWLEDVDFSRQLAAHGSIVKNSRAGGVHLGIKTGRVSGVRFGYSQIANPFYLWRKGTFRLDLALRQMGRNLIANFTKVVHPEPWTDRRGRVLGNILGFCDLICGRLHPSRILDLE